MGNIVKIVCVAYKYGFSCQISGLLNTESVQLNQIDLIAFLGLPLIEQFLSVISAHATTPTLMISALVKYKKHINHMRIK